MASPTMSLRGLKVRGNLYVFIRKIATPHVVRLAMKEKACRCVRTLPYIVTASSRQHTFHVHREDAEDAIV